MNEIWIEKFRPSTLSDVQGSQEAIKRLSIIAKQGNMPHLLISGPPGTGKTSTVLALAKQLLENHTKNGILELNASDERGIDVVRDRIKSFIKEKIILPPGRHKIVILDEADAMTEVAQQALRRLMEVYSESTRFALTCNLSSKIIEPIQSRCAILRFEKLKENDILYQLLQICKAENITYVDSGLEALIFTAEGDMRNAINNLQSTYNGFDLITKENVFKVCDVPPPESIRKIIDYCIMSKWKEAHDIAFSIINDGYTSADIIALFKSVLKTMNVNEALTLEYLKMTSRCHFVISEGVSSMLQIDGLLANLCTVSKHFANEKKK